MKLRFPGFKPVYRSGICVRGSCRFSLPGMAAERAREDADRG
jgi:hypothetical protein